MHSATVHNQLHSPHACTISRTHTYTPHATISRAHTYTPHACTISHTHVHTICMHNQSHTITHIYTTCMHNQSHTCTHHMHAQSVTHTHTYTPHACTISHTHTHVHTICMHNQVTHAHLYITCMPNQLHTGIHTTCMPNQSHTHTRMHACTYDLSLSRLALSLVMFLISDVTAIGSLWFSGLAPHVQRWHSRFVVEQSSLSLCLTTHSNALIQVSLLHPLYLN